MTEIPAMPGEIDGDRLHAFLSPPLGGLAGRPQIARIGGGQPKPTDFVSCDDRRLVLCKQPPGELLPSADAVDREYRVISALASTAVPVPRAFVYCDDRAVLGAPFYVMERLDGRVFHDCTLTGAPADQRCQMYASMADTVAALHAGARADCRPYRNVGYPSAERRFAPILRQSTKYLDGR